MTKLLVLVFVLVLFSCNKYLDELPDNRMEISSATDVKNLLVSAYSEINPAYLQELYSDNTDEFINTGWTAYDEFQEQAYYWQDIVDISCNESPQNLWNAYYTAVATANEALQSIEKLGNGTDYQASKGEALICRAYAMFMLANVFCQAYAPETAATYLGLPYPLEPETTVDTKYERGTLAQLYQQIDADLTAGLALVKNDYTQPKYHFTITAAKAFAARFYLYYRQYSKAIAYATDVLTTQPSGKLRDWTAWSSLSINDMFQPDEYVNSGNRANILLQTVYSMAGYIEGPSVPGSRFTHGAQIDQLETLESEGPWGNGGSVMAYTVFFHTSIPKYILRKIPYAFEYTDAQKTSGYVHAVYSIFNYDETLMVRAEAYALTKQYDKAVEDLNTELGAIAPNMRSQLTLDGIKTFYNKIQYYTPLKPTVKKMFHTSESIEAKTQEPLLQCILHLRRIVTMHEGMRLQDVKRYGINIYRRQIKDGSIVAVTDSMLYNDPRRAVQLPQDVISAGMTANPRN